MSEYKKNKLVLTLSKKKPDNNNIIQKEEINNNCILNNRCPYYKKYIKFKNQILAFITSQEKLKMLNQSLNIVVAEKNKLYREVKNENNYLKGIIFNLTGVRFADFSQLGNKIDNISDIYIRTTPKQSNRMSKYNNILRIETGKNSKKFYDKMKFEMKEIDDNYKKSNLYTYIKNSKSQQKNNKPEKILVFN